MQVKLFTKGGKWKPSTQVEAVQDLEIEINSWLETHPHVVIEHVHHLGHPNLGWSQLTVAVWYQGQGTGTTDS